MGVGMRIGSPKHRVVLYNPHVLSDTTKHETLAKFKKWS